MYVHWAAAALVAWVVAGAPGAAPPVVAYRPIEDVSPVPIRDRAGLKGREDLEAFFDGVIGSQLEAMHIAGATVAVVKDGKPYFAKGYGFADIAKRQPVDAERTLFRMGSVSKPVTWTALMQLVDQRKVDLDADINTYLTQFKVPPAFDRPITIRNLLTHTPGLEDAILGWGFLPDPSQLVPLAKTLSDHLPARVRAPATDFNDATMAAYSNWGTTAAGLIVENVTGMPFDDYMEQYVFAPLGMDSSTFREPPPAPLRERLTQGYRHTGGHLQAQPFEFVHNVAPAGSMMSTATDMAKFMLAHLNGGALGDARILSRAATELMHRRHLSPHPHLAGGALGLYEEYLNGRRLIGHNGETQWFQTQFRLMPEENLGIFVSYNTAASVPVPVRQALMTAFMDRYYPARLPAVQPPADFGPRAKRYAGWYRFTRHAYTTNEKFVAARSAIRVDATADNALRYSLPATGQQWKMVEVAPDVFRDVDSSMTIAFAGDVDGKAQAILNPSPIPFISAYRLAWYDTPPLHNSLLAFAGLSFVVSLVSMVRNWRSDRAVASGARRARRLAGALGTVNLAFIVLFLVGLVQLVSAPLGYWPGAIRVAFVLPLLALPLTAGVLASAVAAWRGSWWTRSARIQYSVIALASGAFVWFLDYWNLIGFKFS